MKSFKILVLLISAASLLVSCYKDDDDLGNVDEIIGLGGDTWAETDLDKWLYDTLIVPYNIAVKYKWDQFEFQLDKTLVPPKESVIKPVMRSIKKVWIDTYIAEAGLEFFNKYSPKFFVLSGSASYNTDGSFTLGTAEGGRKVIVYKVNDFKTADDPTYKPEDSVQLKDMFHTIEHEFGHILHQNINYPQEFKLISAGLYRADWTLVRDEEALRDGFISAYAMSANDEDFAEMISIMFIEGKKGFDAIVNSIPPGTSDNGTTQAQARADLRQKEAIVVDYFNKAYKIDYYRLQEKKRAEIEKLIK